MVYYVKYEYRKQYFAGIANKNRYFVYPKYSQHKLQTEVGTNLFSN